MRLVKDFKVVVQIHNKIYNKVKIKRKVLLYINLI